MDPLQWMGAVRLRVQTADKNITMIHKYSTQLRSNNWCPVKLKAARLQETNPILRHFLIENCRFWTKCKFIIHNNAYLPQMSSRINNLLLICLELFWTVKNILIIDLLTDGLEWCGLSFWQHHSLHFHRWASDVMLISPNLFRWRNKLTHIFDSMRVNTFSANFRFWGNFFFKIKINYLLINALAVILIARGFKL